MSQSFYAERIRKELRTKDRFDKAIHVHGQIKMASSLVSGGSTNTLDSMRLKESNANDVLRNRAFANQESVVSKSDRQPLYFLKSSNCLNPSNPNSIIDMGASRNCVYQVTTDEDDLNECH